MTDRAYIPDRTVLSRAEGRIDDFDLYPTLRSTHSTGPIMVHSDEDFPMSTTAPLEPATGNGSGWPALWALVIGFFMILVDSTIVQIATPALMQGFGADISAVVWVTSAYLLAYAVPLLITGRLGDRFGPKRLYLTGLAVFTVASGLCAMSGTIAMLIMARVLQGLGASMMTPQTMAVITRTFPPDRRGAAMGLWGSTAGVAMLVGPLAGGVLVDTLGWQWIFLVNLPVGIIAFIAATRFVPSLETHRHRFDWLGVVLSALGVFCLVFGIEEGESYDWGTIVGPISVWGLIITGLLIMTGFVLWQRFNTGEPLVPLSLFGDRNFSAANLAIMTMGAITVSIGFPMMLYAQSVRGLSPTQSALLMLPMAVISAGLAPVVGRMINRGNPKPFAISGFVLLALSLISYALVMQPELSVLWLLLPAGILGLASAGIWGPLSVSATRNLPPHQAGAGSGVYNTTRQIGAVLGSAAIAAFMQNRLTAQFGGQAGASPTVGTGQSLPPQVAEGFSTAMAESMLLPVGIAALGALAACLLVGRRRPARDRR